MSSTQAAVEEALFDLLLEAAIAVRLRKSMSTQAELVTKVSALTDQLKALTDAVKALAASNGQAIPALDAVVQGATDAAAALAAAIPPMAPEKPPVTI